MTVTILVLMFIWWFIGFVSTIFWMTRMDNFTVGDLRIAIVLGVVGPISIILFAVCANEEKILFKKRNP